MGGVSRARTRASSPPIRIDRANTSWRRGYHRQRMEKVSATQHHAPLVERLVAALSTWREQEELAADRRVNEAAVQQQIDRAFADARVGLPRGALADS